MRFLIVWVVLVLSAGPAAASPAYIPGEILVKFKAGTPPETIESVVARLKTFVKRKSELTGVRLLSLPTGLSVEEALKAYRSQPDVLYAEPNYIRRASDTLPNDVKFDEQWGLHNTGQTIHATPNFRGGPGADIDAPSAWDITTGSPSMVIAVLDSGVDYSHSDFGPSTSSNIWANAGDTWTNPITPSTGNGKDDDGNGFTDDFHGWNFVGTQDTSACPTTCDCSTDDPVGNNDPRDDFGHGTHVAGIIAAKGNNSPVNSTGITGVLWNAQIMPLKILDANGCGSVGDEMQAIDYAINNGARIINASFGGPGLSSSEEDAIRAAGTAGIVFVAAAGNDGSNNDDFPIYPASFKLPNVISVAATDANDRLSPISNYGKNHVDIGAPGDCIYSTTPVSTPFTLQNDFSCLNSTPITSVHAYITGTSMAAPHVAGVAGLLLSQDPSLTPEEVRAVILLSADPLDSLKGRVASSGRLNASNALRRVKGSGLIGGHGGCGSPIGTVRSSDSDPVPPVQVLLFLLVLFWPLGLPILRRKLGKNPALGRAFIKRGSEITSGAGLLALIVLWPLTAAAAEEDAPSQPVHSLGLKAGYHRYNSSDYFDTNSGLVSPGDLARMSEELEYDRRWEKDKSLTVTAGQYRSETDLKNVCCGSLQFSTQYLLLTPKYHLAIHLGPQHTPARDIWEVYLGGGIGFYHFTRKGSGLIGDHLSSNVLGLHAVVGIEWAVIQRISVFTEARYAVAKVKSADPFDDSLDVGGVNYSLGLRWRFLPAPKLS